MRGKDPMIGQVLLDRYRIDGVIGRGGMSTVYLGEQRMGQASRYVAVKVLERHTNEDPRIVERFIREQETIVRLKHPNTVEIYDVGELPDGTLFFVLEFIEGVPLSNVVKKGALPLVRVDKILIQIAGALDDAHRLGVVHRDLKPANIMVDKNGQSYIMDFGLAKDTEGGHGMTRSGVPIGTPYYMPPEQARGEHKSIDQRADIYALGAVLYEIITHRVPFKASSTTELVRMIIEDEPVPPRQL
ncbi:MAG: serine/threonine protein kinase, partial [Myxococcales bacterium]|nr:serine/threonine protein kinase [Myxococcales bacterium]